MQSKFDALDVNHDGYIDKQEAAADAALKNQFAKIDANKDAKLTITEFSSAKGLAMNKKVKSTESSGSPVLENAYLQYQINDQWAMKAGQWKDNVFHAERPAGGAGKLPVGFTEEGRCGYGAGADADVDRGIG